MLYKKKALEILERDVQTVESALRAMEKRAISPDTLYANLEKLQNDLEQLQTLVNRENEGR